MPWEVEPHSGVGPIRFGMTRDEVRQAVGTEVREFRRWKEKVASDYFESLGIFVYYRPPGLCEAVKFARRSIIKGATAPVFATETFLGKPYRTMRQWFEERDPLLVTDGAGLTSRALGMGLYAASAEKSPDEPVESLIVFETGYYEREG